MDIGDAIPAVIVFMIPIVAIIGGITAGIVKNLGQQRLQELAQRERMLAIERGIPPDKLPPLQFPKTAEMGLTFNQSQLRRSQGLMIGGLISVAVGGGIIAFLSVVPDAREVWAVGLIPVFVGVALLLSAWVVRPRNTD